MKINLKRCMATTETILNHKELVFHIQKDQTYYCDEIILNTGINFRGLDLIFKRYIIFENKDSVIGVAMDKKDFDKYFIILEENT